MAATFPSSFPADGLEHVAQLSDDLRARKGGERSTNENVTKDGRTILCEWYNTPLVDAAGRVIGAASLAQDITEQKRAEEVLQKSERTLRTLIDASPAAIALLDTEGTVLIANETLAHRLDRTVDEITGHIVFNFMPAEVAANRKKQLVDVVRTGKPIRFEDQRLDRYVETAVHPILDAQGSVAAVAVLAVDQTDRKQAEEALRESEQHYRKLSRI